MQVASIARNPMDLFGYATTSIDRLPTSTADDLLECLFQGTSKNFVKEKGRPKTVALLVWKLSYWMVTVRLLEAPEPGF